METFSQVLIYDGASLVVLEENLLAGMRTEYLLRLG